MTVKVNDFFCGAGGMGLGFKIAGFDIAGAWDFDKYAVQSYKANIGEHVEQADISEMTAADVPLADVWTFGFPCQDLSNAGKQAGMKLKCVDCSEEFKVEVGEPFDTCLKCGGTKLKAASRSGLFFEVMRLLDETALENPDNLPRVLLAENVKGLKKFLPVLKEEYNRRGYRMTFSLYNSKYWGVPQNRERYFVVGIREDVKRAFRFPWQQTDYIPKLSGVLEQEVDEKFYIPIDKTRLILAQAAKRVELENVHSCITPDRVEKRQNGPRAKADELESFTLTAQDRHGVILRVPEATKKGYAEATEGDSVNISHPNSKTRRGRVGRQIAQTLLTGAEQVVVEPAAEMAIRKLTPREYARLQGFPDSYKQVVSNSQFYKQMGNAVTVNVSNAIAEHIKAFLEGAPYPEGIQEGNFPPAAVR